MLARGAWGLGRSHSIFWGAGYRRWSGVGAGLLLRTLARVECWQYFFVRTRGFF